MLNFGLGYSPDPYDPRDHDASNENSPGVLKIVHTPTVPLALSASNRRFTKTINQGGLGSCTCNAGVQNVRVSEIKQLVDAGTPLDIAQSRTPFASRLFLYYLARAMDGTTREDAGTFIRNVYRALNMYGFPPEAAWAYSDDADPKTGAFAKMPPAEAFREAYDQRNATGDKNLIDYARITAGGAQRVDDVKRAVMDGHLVEFGTDVSEDFCSDMNANSGKPIDPPVGLRIAGGHAMCIGAYTTEGALVLNSWGEDYGDEGWCLFSWDYITWSLTSDLWIVRKSPLITQEVA